MSLARPDYHAEEHWRRRVIATAALSSYRIVEFTSIAGPVRFQLLDPSGAICGVYYTRYTAALNALRYIGVKLP